MVKNGEPKKRTRAAIIISLGAVLLVAAVPEARAHSPGMGSNNACVNSCYFIGMPIEKLIKLFQRGWGRSSTRVKVGDRWIWLQRDTIERHKDGTIAEGNTLKAVTLPVAGRDIHFAPGLLKFSPKGKVIGGALAKETGFKAACGKVKLAAESDVRFYESGALKGGMLSIPHSLAVGGKTLVMAAQPVTFHEDGALHSGMPAGPVTLQSGSASIMLDYGCEVVFRVDSSIEGAYWKAPLRESTAMFGKENGPIRWESDTTHAKPVRCRILGVEAPFRAISFRASGGPAFGYLHGYADLMVGTRRARFLSGITPTMFGYQPPETADPSGSRESDYWIRAIAFHGNGSVRRGFLAGPQSFPVRGTEVRFFGYTGSFEVDPQIDIIFYDTGTPHRGCLAEHSRLATASGESYLFEKGILDSFGSKKGGRIDFFPNGSVRYGIVMPGNVLPVSGFPVKVAWDGCATQFHENGRVLALTLNSGPGGSDCITWCGKRQCNYGFSLIMFTDFSKRTACARGIHLQVLPGKEWRPDRNHPRMVFRDYFNGFMGMRFAEGKPEVPEAVMFIEKTEITIDGRAVTCNPYEWVTIDEKK